MKYRITFILNKIIILPLLYPILIFVNQLILVSIFKSNINLLFYLLKYFNCFFIFLLIHNLLKNYIKEDNKLFNIKFIKFDINLFKYLIYIFLIFLFYWYFNYIITNNIDNNKLLISKILTNNLKINLIHTKLNFLNVLGNLIFYTILIPLFEEIIYRYDLIYYLEKFNFKNNIIRLYDSLIFTFGHFNYILIYNKFYALYLLSSVFLLSYLIYSNYYLKYKNINNVIILHSFWNFLVYIFTLII